MPMGGSFRDRVAPLDVPVMGTELAAPLLKQNSLTLVRRTGRPSA
jgi:hypothetical protein